MDWTLNQIQAFLGAKEEPDHKKYLPTYGHNIAYHSARWQYALTRDPWGNAPLTPREWSEGKHKK
jgi:hypothetical protein